MFFRAELQERARSLDIAGWVSNRPDGTVEAVLEGDADRVDSLVRWCERGPSGAVVETVDVDSEEPQGESGFSVR